MNTGKILIYQNPQGTIKIDVRLEEETLPLLVFSTNKQDERIANW